MSKSGVGVIVFICSRLEDDGEVYCCVKVSTRAARCIATPPSPQAYFHCLSGCEDIGSVGSHCFFRRPTFCHSRGGGLVSASFTAKCEAKRLSQARSQLAGSLLGYVRPLFGSFEESERSSLRYYSPVVSSFDKPTSDHTIGRCTV